MEITRVNQNLPARRKLYLATLEKQIKSGKTERWHDIKAPHDVKDLVGFDPNRIWVWSDHHFGHKNVIEFSDRPYANIEEMKEHFIANYNDYVGPDDVCFWVGDVAYKQNATHTNKILDQCGGYKILIIGNHDFKKNNVKKMNFDEMHLLYEIEIDFLHDLVFTHYPHHLLRRPTFNIHGHSHTHIFNDPFKINVCVENTQYRPRSLQEIADEAVLRHDKWLSELME